MCSNRYKLPRCSCWGGFAAKKGTPIVLVPPTLTNVQTDYLDVKDPANIYIFGGTGEVLVEIDKQLKK